MAKKIVRNEYYQTGQSPFLYAGYQCNNKCIFCFEADRTYDHKSRSKLKREIEIIRKKFDFINIMGQEPTLRRDIIEIVQFAKAQKFRQIGLTTNGRMFAYPNFCRQILNSGLDQVVVTVVGGDAKTHDKHTLARGSFDQAVKGLKNIIHYMIAAQSLVVNIMITRLNYKQIPKMLDFYAKMGVTEINIGHVMPLNKKIRRSKELIAKMSNVTPYLIKAQNKYGRTIKLLFVEYPACSFPKKYQQQAFPCLEINTQKKRIPLCQKCNFRNKCTGINGFYLDLYGLAEFEVG